MRSVLADLCRVSLEKFIVPEFSAVLKLLPAPRKIPLSAVLVVVTPLIVPLFRAVVLPWKIQMPIWLVVMVPELVTHELLPADSIPVEAPVFKTEEVHVALPRTGIRHSRHASASS